MTHASVAGSPLEVTRRLVRLSVGIEDVDDLIADLRQALDRLTLTARRSAAPTARDGRRYRGLRTPIRRASDLGLLTGA